MGCFHVVVDPRVRKARSELEAALKALLADDLHHSTC